MTREVPIPAEAGIVRATPRVELVEVSPGGEMPPAWWESQAAQIWRFEQWNVFSPEYRAQLVAQRAVTFPIRAPEAQDAVLLWSQFHALKALAARLDGGVANERERAAFEAGLREYNANFDRVRSRGEALGQR